MNMRKIKRIVRSQMDGKRKITKVCSFCENEESLQEDKIQKCLKCSNGVYISKKQVLEEMKEQEEKRKKFFKEMNKKAEEKKAINWDCPCNVEMYNF